MIKVILLYFFHKGLNLCFFFFNHIIERQLHPHKHSIDVAIFLLNSYVFLSIQKVVFLAKLIPKLVWPFCQYTQDSWALYHKMPAMDLLFSINRYVFRNFSTDYIMGVLFNLRGIFFFRNFIIGVAEFV